MEEQSDEIKIREAIDSISIEKSEIILNQMKTCICKVIGEKIGTGFFCKMPYKDKIIPVLITSYDIITDKFIEENKVIKISLNNDKISEEIVIDKQSKIYSSKSDEYNIIIIKLQEEKKFYNYLELDNHLFKENSDDFYEAQSIYVLHYSKNEILISYGYGMKKVDKYCFKHFCDTDNFSPGSPIINLSTNKVIGIHKGVKMNNEKQIIYKTGILLKYPLNDLISSKNIEIKKDNEIYINSNNNTVKNDEINIKKNENKLNIKLYNEEELNKEMKINEIIIKIHVFKEDINRDIYFLDNTDYEDKGIKHYHDNLKELNEGNTELFINDKEYSFKKYFKPEIQGIYTIKLKFNFFIKNCSYMFYNCWNIIDIDLSNFDTKNVTNMKYMFYWCINLININLSSIDIQNVTNMEYMFSKCYNLKQINLSSFKTKNVTNMMGMFSSCKKLENLDLSSFEVKNVVNMEWMFDSCFNLKSIDLSSFDMKNSNASIFYMFAYCDNLEKVKINKDSYDKIKNELNIQSKVIFA